MMNKGIASACLLTLFLAMPAAAQDVHRAAWGHSPRDVHASEEGRLDTQSTVYRGVSWGFAVFREYYFDASNHLFSAIISPRGLLEEEEYDQQYNTILERLTTQYGEPDVQRDTYARWDLPRTRIDLELRGIWQVSYYEQEEE